jgi:DNA polymerase-3 subunit gamma/tau
VRRKICLTLQGRKTAKEDWFIRVHEESSALGVRQMREVALSLPLALKYRPSAFKDVIGQEQVTHSLMSALDSHQVHHAYLFSGPRGCGKTSSARILARSLNCEEGPTSTPCGKCQSCQELIANGPGSLDVIEMDAATHGLVDDARELRDKALFAPVQNRYKIYIIDEAHQLGPAAANALLKIVEEPPPYVIFIFATTEPEKVIPTIRSRTHHYQFRLVSPETLANHLESVAENEEVTLEEGVIPLAVKAGNGSVRDALSSLGLLLNGAVNGGVSYEAALRLLGQTSNELLDQIMEALENQDAVKLLEVVQSLLETGSDLRRFLLELLDRIRDLMVISAVGSEKSRLLRGYSFEEQQKMEDFAKKSSISSLILLSEIVSDHVVRLRSTVSPQITIETMMLRLLQAFTATNPTRTVEEPRQAVTRTLDSEQALVPQSTRSIKPVSKPTTSSTNERIPLTDLRILENNWRRVLESIKNQRRLTWTLLSSQSQPTSFESGVVQISLPSSGALDSFERSNSGEVLNRAMQEIFEGEFSVEMVIKGPQATASITASEVEFAESRDQVTGEELLIKELGAKVIHKEGE